MYPSLQKSFKGCYPFRLATTSFIYPADYATNVRRLGPYLDEVELLLFESRPDALPTIGEIAALARLGGELDLTYNIHLPTDISPCDPDRGLRLQAVARLKHVIDLTAPLSPTTCTLHLPFDPDQPANWHRRTEEAIAWLIAAGVDPAALSIETLDYPIEWLRDLLEAYGLSVCIDVGHLLVHAMDLPAILDRWLEQTAIVHLHGAVGRSDHLSLDRLPPAAARSILERLQRFTGTVSVEVFSFDHLAASLSVLETWWPTDDNRPGDSPYSQPR